MMTKAIMQQLPFPWDNMQPEEWKELARRYGTPFYLFDADAVARRVEEVRSAFSGLVDVYFAVKANPNLGLLRALKASVDGLDISSGGELEQAMLAGFDAAELSFAGPAKTDDELDAAIAAGIGGISCESIHELAACARLAGARGVKARILLRVNPLLANRSYGLKMGGGRPVQFGLDEETLSTAAEFVVAHSSQLQWCGIHCYVGSQCFDPGGIIETTRDALRIVGELERRCGLAASKINLGGGFGLASSEARKELDLAAVGAALTPIFRDFRGAHPECQPLFELGRWLCADAGIYVTSVINCKESRGKRFIACDGGLNHQLAAAGTFGAALRGNFPIRNLSKPEAAPIACHVVGPSCNPTDILGMDVSVPDAAPGDLIGVLMSGAYGLTASPIMFLGRPTPIELVRANGAIDVGRRRHTIKEFN